MARHGKVVEEVTSRTWTPSWEINIKSWRRDARPSESCSILFRQFRDSILEVFIRRRGQVFS